MNYTRSRNHIGTCTSLVDFVGMYYLRIYISKVNMANDLCIVSIGVQISLRENILNADYLYCRVKYIL
jgi:hypothetical protein